jgi:ElaB/YqjD/DUF883 family membrane-anchored ribosome-binding protein
MDTTTAETVESSARERLAAGLQQMVDEAEHLLKNAQRSGSDQLSAARDKLEVQLRRARAELDELQDKAVYHAKRAAREADHAVHEHPYTAMGIAAGVGLLVGMLISRR